MQWIWNRVFWLTYRVLSGYICTWRVRVVKTFICNSRSYRIPSPLWPSAPQLAVKQMFNSEAIPSQVVRYMPNWTPIQRLIETGLLREIGFSPHKKAGFWIETRWWPDMSIERRHEIDSLGYHKDVICMHGDKQRALWFFIHSWLSQHLN